MRAAATPGLRLRVGAFEHRRSPFVIERVTAVLRAVDETHRRLFVHATIIGIASASAVASICFGV